MLEKGKETLPGYLLSITRGRASPPISSPSWVTVVVYRVSMLWGSQHRPRGKLGAVAQGCMES